MPCFPTLAKTMFFSCAPAPDVLHRNGGCVLGPAVLGHPKLTTSHLGIESDILSLKMACHNIRMSMSSLLIATGCLPLTRSTFPPRTAIRIASDRSDSHLQGGPRGVELEGIDAPGILSASKGQEAAHGMAKSIWTS